MLAAREPTITKPSKAAPCSKQNCHGGGLCCVSLQLRGPHTAAPFYACQSG